jgi:sugar lactone lactonase YvrE
VCKDLKRDSAGNCPKPADYSLVESCDGVDENCDGRIDEYTGDCVTTLAGSGATGSSQGALKNGIGTQARFNNIHGIAIDAMGNIYVADSDNHSIRKIDINGNVTTVAGNGTGYLRDGAAAQAQFNNPTGLTVDHHGNIYVADTNNHRIRKITASGQVSTVAGSGPIGAGQGGFIDDVAAQARFNSPSDVVVDRLGNLYVADSGNGRIRKITATGQVITMPNTSQIKQPMGLVFDSASNLYVACAATHKIYKIRFEWDYLNGTVSVLAGSTAGYKDAIGADVQFNAPQKLTLDAMGNLYVVDRNNYKVRKLDQNGKVITVAGTIEGYQDGPTFSARFVNPLGIALDAEGTIYVGDGLSHRLRQVRTKAPESCTQIGATRSCYTGQTGTQGVGICKAGTQTCRDGFWSACRNQVLPQTEVQNGEDDNCDGIVDWEALRMGGADADYVSHPALDSSGNIYITGHFEGTTVFGATTLTSAGLSEIYVAKVDSGGNFLWAKRAGGTSSDYGYGIVVDSSGNTYITGAFGGTAVFGATTLTSAGYGDIYVTKVDSGGNFLWAKRAGGVSSVRGQGIAVDSSGNAYITGGFEVTAVFGATTLTSAGGTDTYIAKVDSGGNFLWAKRAGGTGFDIGNGIAVDSSGNAYITGYFYGGTAVFGATTLTSAGGVDTYIAKVDSGGNFLWAKRAGGTGSNGGRSIAVDSSGNAYITGYFSETALFGATTLTSAGGQDTYIAKADSGGNFLWATRAGGTSHDYGNGIVVDSSGNAYITGEFSGTSVFGATTLTSAGWDDIFVAKVDSGGNFLWAKRAGGVSSVRGQGIAVDSSGNAYVTGGFSGTAVFGATTLTSAGNWDVFIWKVPAP